METVKEKLNELLNKAADYAMVMCHKYDGECEDCPHSGKFCNAVASHLIQNGVTILECGMDCKNCWKTKLVNPMQEWVSVDEPPKENGDYIVLFADGEIADARYDVRIGSFGWGMVGAWMSCRATHWMPRPKPPKGVQ